MSPARGAQVATTEPRSALPKMFEAFERAYAAALPPEGTPPGKLMAAVRYSALSPGKRLRPLLVLTGCAAVGGAWRKAIPAAVAVECVHAFSLVHDDLPAMDDDDMRRGRPTTHRKFGEAIAILAGDALLAQAFESLAGLSRSGVPAERVVESMRVLARAAGARCLVGGQALDIAAEGKRVTEAQVQWIHEHKTGALISASLEIGALVGGADRRRVALLGKLGQELGLAFQIHDDLLNRASSLRRLGKRAGTDQKLKKATYPSVVGEKRSRVRAGALYLRSLKRIERIGLPAWDLGHLVLAMAERES